MSTVLIGSNICKTYGFQVVLDDLSFAVHDRDRIALIGRNGAGKTTLLKIISGQEAADSGTVQLVRGARLGVLNQNEELPATGTVSGYLSETSGKQEWECDKLAARFNLRGDDLKKAPRELSGGYQMRVKLVRMLLTDPEVLLLDEPVNYLDLPTLVLLEAFLKKFAGAFIITSHDREILNNLCTTTWDVDRGKLVTFTNKVDFYLDYKEEQAEYARRNNKKLRREIAHVQEFVTRFGAKASLASQAQSKMKHITKLRSKLKSLETDLPTAAFRLPCPPFTPGTAIRCRDLAIGYHAADGTERRVADNIELELMRGRKFGIVGENGRGKSTLLKTMAGLLPPLAGEAHWWGKADIGYFAQQSEEALAPHLTVLETITAAAPPDTSGERILATAGAFLFRNDDLEKPISVLSGGERARVRLARLILQEHNVLLLDEPTNHLDAETVEILAKAVKEYEGTVVLVSHARTFMNAIAEEIYEVRNGGVRRFWGSYEEYVQELERNAAENDADLPSPEAAEIVESDRAARREQQQAERDRRRRQQKIMDRLAKLEPERSEILKFFFENPTDYSPERQTRLAEIEEETTRLEKEWDRLAA